jgi:hypothetical protein
MPGLHVTDQQVLRYMSQRSHHPQSIAAAKSGFSERTARRIDQDLRLPSQKKQARNWRTRSDPLAAIWPRALEMLQTTPGIFAVTIFEGLQEEFSPEAVPDTVRRTLERRVADWQALNGQDKEVFFPQRHEPGHQAQSDFTVADAIGVTIAGEAFPHRLYHFRLVYSGWEHARVILGGESFTAVAEGMQDALWKLGGIPAEHRTDSLSAAYKNLSRDAQLDFTNRYKELCDHYGMTPTRNNPGVANENGTIESSNHHIKRRLDQALLRRGSRDFESIADYRRFVDDLCDRHTARRKAGVAKEREKLRALPKRRTTDFAKVSVPVTRNSTISVDRVLYTVPSRLIGHKLEIHLYDDRLDCFFGATLVATMERVRVKHPRRGHRINFHHVIGTLRKKPQALRNLVYRDALFPGAPYARAWRVLDAGLPPRQACRAMVALLDIADKGKCVEALGQRLEAILDAGRLPDPVALRAKFAPEDKKVTDVTIPPPDIADYNRLLASSAAAAPVEGGEVRP